MCENVIRPEAMVAIQAKTWMPLGSDTAMLAAEKKLSDRAGMPVVNMWCTHSPKLKKPVAISATTIRSYATSGARAMVGTIIDTIPPPAGR